MTCLGLVKGLPTWIGKREADQIYQVSLKLKGFPLRLDGCLFKAPKFLKGLVRSSLADFALQTVAVITENKF